MYDKTCYTLTAAGLRALPLKPKEESEELPEDSEVALAIGHLKIFWVRSMSATRGSYGMKHFVEKTEGGYCSNGALIKAAERLGIRVKPDGSGINARLYVKAVRARWRQFDKEYPHGRERFPSGGLVTEKA